MTEIHPPIKGAIEFDSIRVYFGELVHIDIRRRTYRGMQTFIYPGNYIIEFSMENTPPMRVEYVEVERFVAVVKALQTLAINGE